MSPQVVQTRELVR